MIVPTYQRRDYISRAVASVLAQTYRDFELIVVDDGSTDETKQALTGLGARMRYYWQENRGVSAARNAGLRVARGEVIAFLDSDDRWLPCHLDVVTSVLRRHSDVVLVSTCPGFSIGGRQQVSTATVFDALPRTLGENLVGYQSCVAIRRHDLLAVGGFDERLRVMEGSELWPRLAARGRFATLRRQTVVRQATRGSLVDRARRDGSYIRALDLVVTSALTTVAGLDRPDRDELVQRALGKRAYANALRALVNEDEDTAAAALREACIGLPELSTQPVLVARRLSNFARDSEERKRHLLTTARIWPDRRSDTALFLRMRAAFAELRAGRPRSGASFLQAWPIAGTPGFARRVLPVCAELVRAEAQRRLHRGREATALQDS